MRVCELSIVLCTFNRAEMLADALADLAQQLRGEPAEIEVLVVDNASTDATRVAVERAGATLPGLRYVFEATPGLSVARNRGVREAIGDWVWFLDDDVRVDPGWLNGIRAARRGLPRVQALGGRVIPEFETGRPHWLGEELLEHYGATDFGDEIRVLAPREYAVGCNVGFRRPLFDEIGLFRTDLGRRGASLRSGEETDILDRLTQRGHAVGYAPGATIRHRVPAPRATLAWLRRRAFAGGRSVVLVQRDRPSGSHARRLRQALVTSARAAAAMIVHGPTAERQVRLAVRLGMARQQLAEWARAARGVRAVAWAALSAAAGTV